MIWFAGVVIPLLVRGEFPQSAVVQAVVFATFVAGDLVAIPFRHLFASDVVSRPPANATTA
jgi:hypothetical protein